MMKRRTEMMDVREKKAKELQELDLETMKELGSIELDVLTRPYSLVDAIRDGIKVTKKARGWGDGESACTLTAASIAAKSRGLI
jgi:hypothetical protein